MKAPGASSTLYELFQRLLATYGPQYWWPAETPFEVMVGAILTQSAAWINVEKAVFNLKDKGLLSPQALRTTDTSELAATIRPSGYFNVKARKLKALVDWLPRYDDDVSLLRSAGEVTLRSELLSIYGIGEETADSILLYACGHPAFVIDAYTVRILERIGFVHGRKDYSTWRSLFIDNLPRRADLFNEYHALLVAHAKNTCRKTPACVGCCLTPMCASSNEVS